MVSNDLGLNMILPNPLPRIALEGSQDASGSLTTSRMDCPDLKAQLRMTSPELQEYVRELQVQVQKRKDKDVM